MSEQKEPYMANEISQENKSKLLFMAKRLRDIANDMDKLSESEEEFIVNKAGQGASIEMAELYNSLIEYLT